MISITFDANGGYCNKSAFAYEGSKYGILPTPVYNGEKYFYGWEDSMGNLITADSICIYSENQTFKAKWANLKYSTTFNEFSINGMIINKEVGVLKYSIHKQSLINAGYTHYYVELEFDAKTASLLNCTSEAGMILYFNGTNAGGPLFNPTVNTKYYHYKYGKFSEDKPFTVQDSLLDGTNTIGLSGTNATLWAAKFSNIKLTITFYKP
jgi:hypothetical protein